MSNIDITRSLMTTDCADHDAPYQDIALMLGGRKVGAFYIDDAPVPDYNVEQEAIARRVVASWNACAGLGTELLERMPEASVQAALPQIAPRVRLEVLQRLVEQMLEATGHCQLISGVCCCGDSTQNHADPMECGHSAVDSGEYFLSSWRKEAEKAVGK